MIPRVLKEAVFVVTEASCAAVTPEAPIRSVAAEDIPGMSDPNKKPLSSCDHVQLAG